MSNLQLSFHTNFGFKKEDILKIIRIASEDQGLDRTLTELMSVSGLGNKKVAPMKAWAKRAGLIDSNNLSKAGQIIFNQDPFLQNKVTEWFIHFNFSFSAHDVLDLPPNELKSWGGWTWFVYDYLPNHPTFTVDELTGYALTIFEDTKKTIDKNFGYLLKAYTAKGGLIGIRYLSEAIKDDKTIPNTYTSENRQLPNPYLIGYCLAQLWQRDFPDYTSILTQDLIDQPLNLAHAFSLSPNQLQDTLNQLEYHHILQQQKAVPPFQLIRRWQDPLDLLEKAYNA